MSDSLTRDFAALLCAWPAEGEELTRVARLLLIDGLAVAAAGAGEPGPRLVSAFTRERGCVPAASVIAQGFATAPELAARSNGMAMHVLDYEPMWSPANHALSTILPALLALAETREAAGRPPQGARVLRGLVKGIEAQGRLRLSSRQIEPRGLTLHPPGVVGPIAAAVACGDMLDLDQATTVAAIGIAASRACGLMANIGSMTKALHCGDAAMHGLEAALLAARGLTADCDALGSPRGYGVAYFGDNFDRTPLLAPLVAPRVLDPGPAWKLFPSQYGTHFAINAALDCRAAIEDFASVRAVTVTAPMMPYVDRPRPVSGLDGKSSNQYCVAAALLDGRVDLASFADHRRFAPDMASLLELIELRQDAAIPARFDAMHVEVAVTLADGRQISRRCDAPMGSWSRPLEPARIEAKASELLRTSLGEASAAAFWDTVAAPPDALSIRELMRTLQTDVREAAKRAL